MRHSASVPKLVDDTPVGGSAVLQVPSALTPSESNYLLNPNHPDFAKIKFGPEQIHRFDRRLKNE
jgi:RES domain-containing protein